MDDLFTQPQVGLVRVDLLDDLPEVPDQIAHQVVQAPVVNLDGAAPDVVDHRVADLAVAQLVPVDQVVDGLARILASCGVCGTQAGRTPVPRSSGQAPAIPHPGRASV
ncbi:hypothetical protein ABZ614_42950 [Streptomyces sp. NPDC013178]|uniref:hypothetical protein n=1 Tax=unclassified Streptomyces TaxID=2593676 RepID=UPI00340C8E8D